MRGSRQVGSDAAVKEQSRRAVTNAAGTLLPQRRLSSGGESGGTDLSRCRSRCQHDALKRPKKETDGQQPSACIFSFY